MRVGLAAVAAAAARRRGYPSRVSCGDALYDADSPVSMMGQDTALSASRTVQFERTAPPSPAAASTRPARRTRQYSSTGGRRLFDLAGGAFDGGSCSGARTDQNGQSLTAPADGDMVLQAAWASGYGQVYVTDACTLTCCAAAATARRRQRQRRRGGARADRGADAGPGPGAVRGARLVGADGRAAAGAVRGAVAGADDGAPTTARRRRLGAAPSSSPSALPTVPPTASFLSITSVGTESTADGTVVGSTTTANDGQQMQVTSADAEVSEYTLTLACEDDRPSPTRATSA
ncbi:FK506 binding protein [Aureococcus anophagefferens]|nr:FK506 binding protein [Aureococcus anophagefferens]